MKFTPIEPPRRFSPSASHDPLIDTAHIELVPNEQVTFKAPGDLEYDVVRKSWGFYATPSINGRLKRFNLRTALVRNSKDQIFVHLVETGREAEHKAYLDSDDQQVLCWLDDSTVIEKVKRVISLR